MKPRHIGFGSQDFNFAIYIANRPPIDHYPSLDQLQPLAAGEISAIVSRTSNHWRKVFNVCAKFIFELQGDSSQVATWQEYREQHLFQRHSREALMFSAPDLSQSAVHIIAGKTHAANLQLPVLLHWLDSDFAINQQKHIVVSPYPDYRQLSNQRIHSLVAIGKNLAKDKQ